MALPTNRSHRVTLETDCPEIVARCLADRVDAALLVANCPVCHQSVSLAARALEEAGIATVVMGCAKDIVEHVGVPRFLFSDFPLGNAAGRPHDRASQDADARARAHTSRTRASRRAPPCKIRLRWSADPSWKLDYANIERLSAEEIARRRADFDRQKTVAKGVRERSAHKSAFTAAPLILHLPAVARAASRPRMRPTRCRLISMPAEMPAEVTIVAAVDKEPRSPKSRDADSRGATRRYPPNASSPAGHREARASPGRKRRCRPTPSMAARAACSLHPFERRRIGQGCGHHAARHDENIGLRRIGEITRRYHHQAMPRAQRRALPRGNRRNVEWRMAIGRA